MRLDTRTKGIRRAAGLGWSESAEGPGDAAHDSTDGAADGAAHRAARGAAERAAGGGPRGGSGHQASGRANNTRTNPAAAAAPLRTFFVPVEFIFTSFRSGGIARRVQNG